MRFRNQTRLIFRLAWLAGFACLLLAGCVSAGAGGSLEATMPAFPSPTPQAAAPTSISTTPLSPETAVPQATDTLPPDPTETTPALVNAAALPDPAGYDWQPVATGMDLPIGLAFAKDGSNRVFILEQEGRIRILRDEELIAEPFLDITDRVGANGSERGLLGLAFHPDYTQNGFFYVNYTDDNGNTVISRFTVTADPNLADPATEMRLIFQEQPFANHNGGGMEFGPDGYLYLGLGDGGSGGDPQGNGQSTGTLLGKLLRIDVNTGDPYGIPSDNPFAGGDGLEEIWAYGLRNPWRFTFDRATGDLYIADVGQNAWEEIDFQPAGAAGGINYGWNLREGAHPFRDGDTGGQALVDPVAEYSHDVGGCSVTGGVVYRGPSLPEWQGVYLYGDYCTGLVWGLLRQGESWSNTLMFQTSFSITAFGEDELGEVYVADHGGGVYRLVRK